MEWRFTSAITGVGGIPPTGEVGDWRLKAPAPVMAARKQPLLDALLALLPARLFAPGILEGYGAVEDGLGARLVIDAVCDEVADPFELA